MATQEADIVGQVSDNNASPAGQSGISRARGLRHQQQTLAEEEEEEDACLPLPPHQLCVSELHRN